MKRFLFFTVFFVLFFNSCLSSKVNEEYPRYFCFVTASFLSEEGSAQPHVILLSDADKVLNVVNNDNLSKKIRNGQRAVAFFDMVNGSIEDDLPAEIKLSSLDTCVVIGNSAIVKDSESIKSYGESPMDVNISPYYPSLTPKYFNLYICAYGSDPYKHSFSLVYNQDDPGKDDSLNLRLCHDDHGDSYGYQYWHWISLPRAEFTSLMLDKSEVVMGIKTRSSDFQTLRFSLKSKE